jgi:hypothetical protein
MEPQELMVQAVQVKLQVHQVQQVQMVQVETLETVV